LVLATQEAGNVASQTTGYSGEARRIRETSTAITVTR
jgi:hypothetical protein